MNLRVQFFSHLKDVTGTDEFHAHIPEGGTVADLLTIVYGAYPKLRDWDPSILCGVGVEFVERDYLLKEGDEIALMPPVQGG